MAFQSRYLYLYISVLFFTVSCTKKEGRGNPENDTKAVNDTNVRMAPYTPLTQPLKRDYVAATQASINNFVNKTWRNENDNISFLVSRDGEIIYEKYQGSADRNKGTTITSQTPLHLASVSKVLTATAVLELIDSNKIKLDQKVNTILTGFPYPEITVKTLLNHRSGLKNYAYYTDDRKIWDHSKALKNQDILDLFIRNEPPLDFKTDKKFAYCNTNYAMLALIIEKVLGMTYKVAMKKMIFDPLGMTNTFVFDYDADQEKIVPSYKGNNMEIGLDFLDAVYGDKNIYSTPRDMLKFDSARYNPDYLNPALMKKVYVGYSYEHKGEKNYGLGIRIIEWVTGQHFYFHNGWWHGNTSSYVNLKNEKVMIIALSNKFTPKTYKVRFLATLFGDYPFKLEKDDIFF